MCRRRARAVCVLGLLLAVALAGCARDHGGNDSDAAAWTGHWRVALQLPGGELPFGLELEARGDRLHGTIVNGPERIDTDEIAVKGDELRLTLPGLETEILARRDGARLGGTVTMVKQKAVRQRIPFVAQRGEDYGFFPGAAEAGSSVDGRWAVTFTDDEGQSYAAVGEFTQQDGKVTGTFLTPTADYRYLSGELRKGQLFLRSFNGGHAFLFHARIDGETLRGDYWSGLAWHERFEGRRDETASLGDAEQATKLREGEEKLDFSLPDLDGHTVSLSDPRFQGKVVVVTLGGSWCPNCHDEAAVLAPWYRELRAQGLEIIGLMFEQYADFGEAAHAVARFRDRYGIEYPLLVAGENDRDQAARLLPQLNGVFAYPTTIFIDRKGKVRRIHTGFSGPATRAHYETLKQDYDHTIRELLAEKG